MAHADSERSQAEIRRHLYISAIQSDRLAVSVGHGRKIYHIPEGLLTQHSMVIRERFEWYKQKDEPIDLQEMDIATFEEFLLWLYAFEHYAGWESIDAVIDLAIFADQYGIRQLKNQTSDFLQAAINEHRWKATPEHLHKVYDGVPAGALLRQLCFLAFSIAVGSTEVINRHLHSDRIVDRLPCAAWEPVFTLFPSLGWDYFRHVQAGQKRITKTAANGACRFHDHEDVRGWAPGTAKICPYPHGAPAYLVLEVPAQSVLETVEEVVEGESVAAAEVCIERAADDDDEQSAGAHTPPDSGVAIEEIRPRLSPRRRGILNTKSAGEEAAATEGVVEEVVGIQGIAVPEEVIEIQEKDVDIQKVAIPDGFTELEEPLAAPEPEHAIVTKGWGSWTSKEAEGTLEESPAAELGWGKPIDLPAASESAVDGADYSWFPGPPKRGKNKRRGTVSFEESPKIDDILLAEPELAPGPDPEPTPGDDVYPARSKKKTRKKSWVRSAESADIATREYDGEEAAHETPPPSVEEQQTEVPSWANWGRRATVAEVIF